MHFKKQKYTQFRERNVPQAPGVYKISINSVVRYVGRAVNLRTRYNQHLQTTEHNLKLFNEMQSNGDIGFEFLIIHERDKLEDKEKKEIIKYGDQLFNSVKYKKHNKGG